MIVRCSYCGGDVEQRTSAINRAVRECRPLYCDRICFFASRRESLEVKKAKKAGYDIEYRAANLERIKAGKAAWYAKTADREKERAYRKANMHKHVAYCRRPEYRAYKQQYDAIYRSEREFGEFAEAALILRNVELEIESRATRYEVYAAKETLNKAQTRRRALNDQSRQNR